jgi:Leucine-rich repeat (LRR) protein
MTVVPLLARADSTTSSDPENNIQNNNGTSENNKLRKSQSSPNAESLESAGTSEATYRELNLSHRGFHQIPAHYMEENATYNPTWVRTLLFSENALLQLPTSIGRFEHLRTLDLSNNSLVALSPALGQLSQLRVLSLANNQLESSALPKTIDRLGQLEALNLGGNRLDAFPSCVHHLKHLKAIYLGANLITELPYNIGQMSSLEILYLGGNQLTEIPATIGRLRRLVSLVLCDNKLETIPATIADLHALQSLSLHNNRLTTLPPEIVKLRRLHQLSLRSNPLVARFVRDLQFEPPSLRELSGRAVKLSEVDYQQLLPRELVEYLNSANRCVNPRCGGVYFDSCVEHVKFVDFCGKYRVPLLQYLCSPQCGMDGGPITDLTTTGSSTSTDNEDATDGEFNVNAVNNGASSSDDQQNNRLKKVLLG